MTRSPPHRITLILVTALAILTLNMFLPSLANIARDLETSYAVVSLAVAGYLGITAVVHLVIGPLSDRYGRRPVLLSVLVLFIAASIICSLAENIWMFLLFRMLQAGMASGSALSMVIVRDTHSKREAAGVIGYISMAMALAPMLGPILGGTLDAAFGWRSVFHFYALAGFCMFVLCWLDVGETRPERAHNADGNGDTFWTVAREPRFWAYALCTAFSTGAFYIFIAGAPLVADTTFKVSTAQLGLFIGSITGGFMLGSFFAGRYSPHHPLATMMIAGRLFAFGGLILGLTLVLSGWLSPLLFFGCTIFVGFGNGITMPSSNSGVMSVSATSAGTAAGLNGAFNVTCGALLTLLTGFVLTPANAPVLLMVLMLTAVVVSLLAALWARRFERNDAAA